MSTPYYVLLTGAKLNSGDFLIAQRAKRLLATLRPDRAIVEFNRWEPLSEEDLAVVNGARALLLTGGPALRPEMYPGIYPLVPNLDDIRVPIMTFGIGWKSASGMWSDVPHYRLSAQSQRLLRRIEASGYPSSLRDYRSEAVTRAHGAVSFRVTGCPALFSPDSAVRADVLGDVRRIVFSPGVEFVRAPPFERQMKEVIARCRRAFPVAEFVVALHHGEGPPGSTLAVGHRQFIAWLNAQGLRHEDISASADRMLALYRSADLHVGYRVHAHILMASERRASILIAEDGRGQALRDVLGGAILSAYRARPHDPISRALRYMGSSLGYRMNAQLWTELEAELKPPRLRAAAAEAAAQIDRHAAIMRDVLGVWP